MNSRSFTLLVSGLLYFLTLSSAQVLNTIFIITNAEEPSLGRTGLTPIGAQRATQCLPKVFTPEAIEEEIGLIMACKPDRSSGDCLSAPLTAQPIANALNLTLDVSCTLDDEDNNDCATKRIKKFAKNDTRAILLVWDNDGMDTLGEDLDIDDIPDFPDGNFDVIFTIRGGEFISQTSQNCPGIDGIAPGFSGLFANDGSILPLPERNTTQSNGTQSNSSPSPRVNTTQPELSQPNASQSAATQANATAAAQSGTPQVSGTQLAASQAASATALSAQPN